MRFLRTLTTTCAMLFMTVSAAAAQGLEINEVGEAGHETIVVKVVNNNVDWGPRFGTVPPRSGPGTLRVEARSGRHSEQLARWHREQTRLSEMRLVPNDRRQTIITMKPVFVSSYQTGGSTDSISFNFDTIRFD